jgi:hypothetical protein
MGIVIFVAGLSLAVQKSRGVKESKQSLHYMQALKRAAAALIPTS